MDNQPLISVVIPTYNRAEKVLRAVRSVLDQTYKNIEVIVVNDASPDNTLEVLSKVDDPKLKVVNHQVNKKLSEARNTGIAAAKGDWIAFLDDDDEWLPNKLGAQFAFMKKHNLRLSTTDRIFKDADESNPYIDQNSRLGNRDRQLVLSFLGLGSTGLVRKDTFDLIGGFDPKVGVLEDLDWLVRFGKNFSGGFGIVPQCLVVYNGMHTPGKKFVHAWQQMLQKHGNNALRPANKTDRLLRVFHFWSRARDAFNSRDNKALNSNLVNAARCSPIEALRVGARFGKDVIMRKVNERTYPKAAPAGTGFVASAASIPVTTLLVMRWEMKTLVHRRKSQAWADDKKSVLPGTRLMRRSVVAAGALLVPLRSSEKQPVQRRQDETLDR